MEDNYTGIDYSYLENQYEEEELVSEEQRAAAEQAQLQQQQLEQQQEEATAPENATPQGMKPVNNEKTGGKTVGFSDGDNFVPNTPEDLKHANTPANEFGASENWTEAQNAWDAGVSSAAGSTLSFTERVLDRMNGEDTSSDEYEPEWDPWGKSSPLHKTWWGGLIYETSKAVTYATGFTLAAAAIGVGGATTAIGAAGRGILGAAAEGVLDQDTDKASGNLGKNLYDASQAESENLINGITKQVPQLDPVLRNNPFRVRPEDSPEWIKFKNVMELIGITGAAEFVTAKLFANPDAAKARTDDVRAQTVEKGKQELADELREMEIENQLGGQVIDVEVIPDRAELPSATEALPGTPDRAQLPGDQTPQAPPPGPGTFRGSKNKPLADPWQGAHTSRSSAYDVAQQSKKVYETGKKGSADGLVTPAAAERMYNHNGIDPDLQRIQAKELLGDERMTRLMQEVEANNLNFEEVFGYAFSKMQETMGRFSTAVDVDDFWKPIMDEVSFRTGGRESMEAWAMENVVAADLINASLFSKMRDAGIAINEIHKIADVLDTDGPVKTIADYMAVGLENVKRSRYLISSEFRKLAGDKKAAKKAVQTRMKDIHKETKKNIEMMIDVMLTSDDPNMAMKFAEYFSKADKIQNWTDLDKFMRLQVKGAGMFNDTKPGVLFNQLDGVMTNSILSGPKTAWRAIQGTGTVATLRPISTAIGAAVSGNKNVLRSQLAGLNAMVEMIPESWKLLKAELDSAFNKDVISIKNRFELTQLNVKDDLEAYNFWLQHPKSKTHAGDWAAGQIAGLAYGLNKNRFLSGIPRVMGAVDSTNDIILARARARQRAMTAAMERHPGTEITSELVAEYQDNYMKMFTDAEGDLDMVKMKENDPYLVSSQKEATLTADLKGFAGDIEGVFKKFPFTRPFFRFARTAVNGQMLTYKNSPALGMLHKEFFDVMRHTGDDFTELAPYGITNKEDLAFHKNLLRGRQIVGTAVVTAAGAAYVNGRLTGPGPTDPATRRLWRKLGYPFNSVKVWTPLGEKWVNYEAFEPYNTILSTIATIGDNQKNMGDDWTEQNLFAQALSIGLAASTKSYLDVVDDFMQLVSGDPSALDRIMANIANSVVPLGGARNDLGKLIQPYQLELKSGIVDSIKNRNRITQENDAPIKIDFLNGDPLRDWNIFERFYDVFVPIPLRNVAGPGREMLFNSGYNLNVIGFTGPNGEDLKELPKVLEAYHQEMGKLNVEAKLDELAKDPLMQNSINGMAEFRRNSDAPGMTGVSARDFPHFDRLNSIMKRAQMRAWARMKAMPEVQKILEDKRQENIMKNQAGKTDKLDPQQLLVPTR
jgi:hypothetical protein